VSRRGRKDRLPLQGKTYAGGELKRGTPLSGREKTVRVNDSPPLGGGKIASVEKRGRLGGRGKGGMKIQKLGRIDMRGGRQEGRKGLMGLFTAQEGKKNLNGPYHWLGGQLLREHGQLYRRKEKRTSPRRAACQSS